MLGLFPGTAKFTQRLQAVGYVEAVSIRDCLLFPKGVGIACKRDGLVRENALASYTHLHALGNEKAFLRFLEAAR